MAKFYVTTSIPYVNGAPHLGHAMEFIQADTLARYHRLLGETVLFSSGTDEHGAKNLEKAQATGKDPQAFVDAGTAAFQKLAKALNISNDLFVRTTDAQHKAAVQHLWGELVARGDIYKGTYRGYYDVGEEEFVTETEAKANKGVSPHNGRPYETLEEENYFFKLSKYSDSLRKLIEKDEYRVVPSSRKHEILAVLKDGLQDISFSRPKEKLPWGVEVPNDTSQVMYVWPDALGNYITVLGYPDGKNFKQYWPADVHIIGKNILRFHAALWPAMLLGLGLPLPKALYAHGFITVNGKKMGKSLGNAIDPFEVVERYGADAVRYYFLHDIPSYDDGDFSWERLAEVYQSDLANSLGNLVQRTATMVKQYQDGKVGVLPKPAHDAAAYHQALQDFRFDQALEEVWQIIRGLNQYVDEKKPWELAKSEAKDELSQVLAYLVSNILAVAKLIAPFLPATADRIEQTFDQGSVHTEVGVLFPRLETDK